MTVLRASMWVVVITLLASTPAGDLEPDLTDLERTARSLGLATIFSLADQALGGTGAVEQHPSVLARCGMPGPETAATASS
jgi:hypothetical protein